MSDSKAPTTGAESLLLGLKAAGIDFLFANAGTDFPSIIEGLASRGPDEMPQPVLVPHETAGPAMAHGYYLVTGRPQAVMVHVNVGLANAAMGAINAASDNIPMVLMSGRTPLTEKGREGSRATPIQYGQEMFDQTSIVRDVVKWNYEMRYPEQGAELAERAVTLSLSEPRGPVYLSLPREPLAERVPPGAGAPAAPPPPAAPMAPSPDAVARAAGWIAAARRPVILCQRGDPEGRLGPALSAICSAHGIRLAEPFPVRNVLASDDPALAGYDPAAAMQSADLVLVLDSGVPWIERFQAPPPEARIIHVGPDPHFRRMPVRGYRTDLAIAADPAGFVEALAAALPEPSEHAISRRGAMAAETGARLERARQSAAGGTDPISAAWFSACIGDILGADGVIFSELGVLPGAMRLAGQNRYFGNPHSGGLGWAMPAALGAQLADRERLVVAAMGDGSYMFANPVACHQIAEALRLPVLTVVKNNAMWNAVRRSVLNSYPDGAATRANTMPLTSLEPQPDFCGVARAGGAFAQKVDRAEDLPEALARAMTVINDDRRQAFIDVRVAAGDQF